MKVVELIFVFVFQLAESDQELYKDFPLTISERWQEEIAETVFEAVNIDADKQEAKKRAKKMDEGGAHSSVSCCL